MTQTLFDRVVQQRHAADDIVIIAQNLTKQFGEEYAARDVSFEIPRGKIFGFIGPSGSGKTTTVRLLAGIYEPTSGEARVFGKSPSKFTQTERERIGYMPQLFVLYPNLTVWENLNFAASIYGLGWWRNKRLNALLDFVELSEHRHKLTNQISGGMQRRLSLAATLTHNPDLIFLDEPTAGIDPVLRRKFWDHFNELQEEGRTLFITTQYVGEAAYCDYVGVMAGGRLLMVETPDGLRRAAFGGEVVDLALAGRLDWGHLQMLRSLPFIQGQVQRTGDNSARLTVDEASTAMPALMDWSKQQNLEVERIEEFLPPFDDVFVELMEKQGVAES
jgi:ABC-2 type transport system ATP-binding protein